MHPIKPKNGTAYEKIITSIIEGRGERRLEAKQKLTGNVWTVG
jgi:hypothetical protein